MARTARTPTSSSGAAPPPLPPLSSRVTKSRNERTMTKKTRQSSRSIEQLQSILSGAQDGIVHESTTDYSSTSCAGAVSKGKRRAEAVQEPTNVDMDDLHDVPVETVASELSSVLDSCDKPFPIMELPTEIRLEIYRACLTRPYNILLSKREKLQHQDPDDAEMINVLSDSHSDAGDTDDDAQGRVSTSQAGATTTTSGSSTSLRRSTVVAGSASYSSRPIRLLSNRSATTRSENGGSRNSAIQQGQWPSDSTTAVANNSNERPIWRSATSRSARRNGSSHNIMATTAEPIRNQLEDPLVVNILLASKEIYKEARSVLYSENYFTLDLNTAMGTLACLHQRSRRQIKHVELEIPTYNEILERFQETVRLSLRYCSGLKRFVIDMPFTLPGADGSGTTGNTTVYANGFDILRWLPQECGIILKGNSCVEIETVVNKHSHLARTLDKVSYNGNQLSPNLLQETFKE